MRAVLMIGAAALALCAGQAHAKPAKSASATENKAPAVSPVDDGLGAKDIYMEADTVADDRGAKTRHQPKAMWRFDTRAARSAPTR